VFAVLKFPRVEIVGIFLLLTGARGGVFIVGEETGEDFGVVPRVKSGKLPLLEERFDVGEDRLIVGFELLRCELELWFECGIVRNGPNTRFWVRAIGSGGASGGEEGDVGANVFGDKPERGFVGGDDVNEIGALLLK
jgi:hypothetical protein